MTTNTAITTSASGDSFTVLNGSTSNQNTSTGNKQRCVSCTEELRVNFSTIIILRFSFKFCYIALSNLCGINRRPKFLKYAQFCSVDFITKYNNVIE